MRTLLKGGSVVSAAGVKRADVLIDGEKIARVGRSIREAADTVVDVEHCLLFPGFIDAHTHFDLDVAGTTTADDFYTGSRAALRGGTTTVFMDIPEIQLPILLPEKKNSWFSLISFPRIPTLYQP